MVVLKIFYLFAWIISLAVWTYFMIQNIRHKGKFLMQMWISLAFVLIFNLAFKVWGGM